MGAGFIGCIIMEALKLRGVELSVVEMGDRMVPRMMGPMAGGMIRDWCEAKGVKVYTSAKVEAIEKANVPAGLMGKITGALGLGGGSGKVASASVAWCWSPEKRWASCPVVASRRARAMRSSWKAEMAALR
jgi:NADPH-dependent 2,4-dienoyl-CoA reductase/sulfur reductase-like enzyme